MQASYVFQTAYPLDDFFKQAGTLNEWKTNVAARCEGNPRLVLGVSTAFAGPLLAHTGAESGGIHLFGGSSVGKTTMLIVAGSVWGGGGPHGYLNSWRTTSNGLESVALMHNDTLLCLDEISEISSHEAGQTAYMLANGRGKKRARADASGRPVKTWRLLFLSTGELSLANKIEEDPRLRAKAGQSVRVIDVPAIVEGGTYGLFEDIHDAGSAQAFADLLKREAGTYYGVAGPAFVRTIIQCGLSVVAEDLRERRIRFEQDVAICPANADGQVRRVLARFSLIAAAGELALELGIVPWPKGAAYDAAKSCFRAWLAERKGGVQAAEIATQIAQIRKFYELHGESRFTLVDMHGRIAEDARPTLNRAGFRRASEEDGNILHEFYTWPGVFRDEICKGIYSRELLAALIGRRILIPGSDGKPQSLHNSPDLGTTKRFYRISSKIFEGIEEGKKDAGAELTGKIA